MKLEIWFKNVWNKIKNNSKVLVSCSINMENYYSKTNLLKEQGMGNLRGNSNIGW